MVVPQCIHEATPTGFFCCPPHRCPWDRCWSVSCPRHWWKLWVSASTLVDIWQSCHRRGVTGQRRERPERKRIFKMWQLWQSTSDLVRWAPSKVTNQYKSSVTCTGMKDWLFEKFIHRESSTSPAYLFCPVPHINLINPSTHLSICTNCAKIHQDY